MSVQGLLLLVVLGAALIACWLDVRVRRPQPRGVFSTLLNMGAAFAVLSAMPATMMAVVGDSDSPVRKMAALFLVTFPAFAYAFLSVLWFFKLAQSMMRVR